jgi:Fe-S cluster assembly iron-binding protein IscA
MFWGQKFIEESGTVAILAASMSAQNARRNTLPLLLLVSIFAFALVTPAQAAISVTVSPQSVALNPGAQQQFSAQVTGTTNSVVNWSLSGPGCSGIACGQITSRGVYTAPASAPIPNIVNVKATSVADATQSGSATISINTSVTVGISPATAQLVTGTQQQFSATIKGSTDIAVTWSVSGTGCSGAACGTITTAGLYTAPGSVPNPATVTVTATSQADPTKSASATVAVVAPVAVSVSPASANLVTGAQQQFTATVTGTTNTAVTWSLSGAGCSGPTCGTITAVGLYTAPSAIPNPATVTVTATSQADSTKSAQATVTVAAAVAVSVLPTSANVAAGAQRKFTATVTGTTKTAVTWSLSGVGCNGAACGTITAAGLYTAPATVPNPATVTVTATSQADPTKSAKATVTIAAAVAVSVSPTSANVVAGAQRQFTATVTGTTNTAVTWSLSGAGCSGAACGTINTAGLYTAPNSVPSPAAVTVTATSQADATKSASATVTVLVPVKVSVSPASASIATGAQQQFTATVTGTTNTAVTWSVSGTGCSGAVCGTITAAGLYTAPGTIPSPATVTVTATSQADNTKSAQATVTVVAPVLVSVSPTSANVVTGSKQQFTATVTGTTNTAVTWSLSGAGCSGAACGTTTSAGLYTAPATVPSPATVTVTATSQADNTKSAQATVTVVAPVLVSVSPTSTKVVTGAQQQFTATVTGTANTAVSWSVSGTGCSGTACGLVTSTGFYTAPATIPNPPTVAVTATSQADVTKSASATVTIVTPIVVSISPPSVKVITGANQKFTATVTGTTNTAVIWTLTGAGCSGSTCGTITAAGLYTAPVALPSPPTLTVKAISVADSSKSASATVTVIPPLIVRVLPAPALVTVGEQLQFTAQVSGAPSTTVKWSVSGTGCSGTICGSISSTGLYTAPASAPTGAAVQVVAAAAANVSKTGSASVTVEATDNGKLNGPFAFLFQGLDAAGIYQAAGTFVADGEGGLVGVEDINRTSGPRTNQSFTGTYTIGPDNRGTFTITLGSVTSTFAFALSPTGQIARFIEFDASGVRGSGILKAQNPADFSTAALTNSYVLSISGGDAGGARLGALGVISASAGKITGNLMDVNDGGTEAPPFIGFPGDYNIATNGRGTASLFIQGFEGGTFHLSLYVVSAQEVFLLSTDPLSTNNPIFSGEALQQSGAPSTPSSLLGNAIFSETGLTGGFADVSVGLMSFDGGGSITGQFDENNGGSITAAGTLTGVYSVAVTGRVAMNVVNAQNHSVSSLVAYIVSPNSAFLMDLGPTVKMGQVTPQLIAAPFGNSSLAGDLIFGPEAMAKADAPLATGVDLFDGKSALTGTEDLSQTSGLTSTAAVAGSYSVSSVSNNGRGTMTLKSPAPQSISFWMISFSEFVGVDVDPSNVSPTFVRFEQ